MKTYRLILAVVVAVAILGGTISCDDNGFLEEKTKFTYTISNAFQVQSQVKDCVSEIQALYFNLRYYGDSWLLMLGEGTEVGDEGDLAAGRSSFHLWSSQYAYTQAIFNNYYKIIAQANLALRGAEEVNWTNEDLRKRCIGEARFFRGLSYLGLGELFGGVPINLTFEETPKFDYPRASREETYLTAIEDLEAASALLEKHPGAGHPGKGVCETLLTEAYIALATIKNNDAVLLQKAVTYASSVMTYHSLMTQRFGVRANPNDQGSYNNIANYDPTGNVYSDLFQRGNYDYEEGNTESLWVKQSDFEGAIKNMNMTPIALTALRLPRSCATAMRTLRWRPEYMETGAATGPFNVTAEVDEFNLQLNVCAYIGGRTVNNCSFTHYVSEEIWKNDDDDLRGQYPVFRRSIKVIDKKHSLYGMELNVNNISKYITDATSFKFAAISSKTNPMDDWGYQGLAEGVDNRTFTYNDYYIYRLADTYLLRAEAYFRLGKSAEAAADINVLRTRAQAKTVSAGEVDLNYILDERLRELIYEELRWNTLLRMGGDIPQKRLLSYSRFTHDFPNVAGSYSGTLFKDFLFPIPQSFIDSNTEAKIEQNPGWQ